jgi:hypothetical protein
MRARSFRLSSILSPAKGSTIIHAPSFQAAVRARKRRLIAHVVQAIENVTVVVLPETFLPSPLQNNAIRDASILCALFTVQWTYRDNRIRQIAISDNAWPSESWKRGPQPTSATRAPAFNSVHLCSRGIRR